MVSTKRKGTTLERELIHFLWDNGWAPVRAAGSGSSSLPMPDIIAGNGIRRIVIECKVINATKKYFTKSEIEELLIFAEKFGAEPWVYVKFNNIGGYFISVSDLNETKSGFVIDALSARTVGIKKEEFVV